MYDGFQVHLTAKNVLDRVRLMSNQVEHTDKETGDCHDTIVNDGLFIETHSGWRPGVTIRGSLHELYTHGDNSTLFTLSQARKSVEGLAWRFCINLRERCLQRLELGVNIPAKCPEAIIDAAVLYHGKPAKNRKLNKKHYFKEWTFADYTIKLYRKRTTLLRFEVHINRLRVLDGGRIRSLEDLRHRDVFVKCLNHLLSCIDEFVFVPSKVDAMPANLREMWAEWRNDTSWLQLQPYQKTREKQRVLQAIKEYDMIDWAVYLRKNTVIQGAQMLGVSETQLAAMISTLGLHAETVAGPIGNCDRQTVSISDAYPSKSVVSICLIHSVRNEGLGHIPTLVRVYSDVRLGGRGPPGAFFLPSKLVHFVDF